MKLICAGKVAGICSWCVLMGRHCTAVYIWHSFVMCVGVVCVCIVLNGKDHFRHSVSAGVCAFQCIQSKCADILIVNDDFSSLLQ